MGEHVSLQQNAYSFKRLPLTLKQILLIRDNDSLTAYLIDSQTVCESQRELESAVGRLLVCSLGRSQMHSDDLMCLSIPSGVEMLRLDVLLMHLSDLK